MRRKQAVLSSFLAMVYLSCGIPAHSQDTVVVVPLIGGSSGIRITDNYSGLAMRPLGTGIISTEGGCAYNNGGTTGIIPLVLPLGAQIISAGALAYDNDGNSVYGIFLERQTISGQNYPAAPIGSDTGGSNLEAVLEEHDITPAVTETVGVNESFFILFLDGGDNGLCNVKVTYELPSE